MAGEPDDAASQPQKTTSYMLRGALIVSLAILLLFGLMGSLLIFRPVKLEGETLQIVTLIMGTLVSMVSVVGQYWLGSSAGSTLKNATMMQQAMLPKVVIAPSTPEPLRTLPDSSQTAPIHPAPTTPPKTPSGPFATAPDWFLWGLHEIGVREEPENKGAALEDYIRIGHSGEIGQPWCAIFVNACLESTTFRDGTPKLSVRGSRSPSSQSYRTDPNFIPLQTPVLGALAVFYRNGKDSGQGHVGFYRGESADGSKIWVLGGNEDNMVQIEALPRDDSAFGLIGYFWPKSVPVPTTGPVIMPAGSPTNVKTPPTVDVTTPSGQKATKFMNIVATVFGGPNDPQDSAYTGKPVNSAALGCALPFRFTGDRPKVKAENTHDPSKSCVMEIVDVGPWNTKDPYWETHARPQAESGIDLRGRKTNGAGIDLTPGAAIALGIDGKGLVNWQFVDDAQQELPLKLT